MRGVERVFYGYESCIDELNGLLKYFLECSQEDKDAIYEYITALHEVRDRLESKYIKFSNLKSYYAELVVARYKPGNTEDKFNPQTGKTHRSCFMYKNAWHDTHGLPIETQD